MEYLQLKMILIAITRQMGSQLSCIQKYLVIKVQAKRKVESNKTDKKVKNNLKKKGIDQNTWILLEVRNSYKFKDTHIMGAYMQQVNLIKIKWSHQLNRLLNVGSLIKICSI